MLVQINIWLTCCKGQNWINTSRNKLLNVIGDSRIKPGEVKTPQTQPGNRWTWRSYLVSPVVLGPTGVVGRQQQFGLQLQELLWAVVVWQNRHVHVSLRFQNDAAAASSGELHWKLSWIHWHCGASAIIHDRPHVGCSFTGSVTEPSQGGKTTAWGPYAAIGCSIWPEQKRWKVTLRKTFNV